MDANAFHALCSGSCRVTQRGLVELRLGPTHLSYTDARRGRHRHDLGAMCSPCPVPTGCQDRRFARHGLLFFARCGPALVRHVRYPPRLLLRCVEPARTMPPRWLNLVEGRLKPRSPLPQWRGLRLSSPGLAQEAQPIPRAGQESLNAPSCALLRPEDGCAAIALGLQTVIEVAMVAGSNNQGDVTGLISAPSRSWAKASSRAHPEPADHGRPHRPRAQPGQAQATMFRPIGSTRLRLT
jgi:hypothetical protein